MITQEDAPTTELERERAARHATQIREVAQQGFLYVGTFFLSYSAAFVVRYLESKLYTYEDEADFYPLLVLGYGLLPLQGLFNCYVYNLPNITRVRAAYPEMPRMWVVQQALFSRDIPKLAEVSISNLTALQKSGVSGRHDRRYNQDSISVTPSELPQTPQNCNNSGDSSSHDEEQDSEPLKGPSFASTVHPVPTHGPLATETSTNSKHIPAARRIQMDVTLKQGT